MKILYVTTVGITMTFFKSLIKELVDEGNVVDIATNETEYNVPDFYRDLGCNIYHISTSRSIKDVHNLKAVNEIRELAKNYDIVHCHTPVAGVLTRIACRKLRRNGLKVFYTAHGFHFFKGGPKKNWAFYPIEKICSRWTDVLITITQEDYELACKHFHARQTELIHGVGIDIDKFKNTTVDIKAKRQELGVPNDAYLILSVGELNKNKNHEIVIRALSELDTSNIYYIIAGEGPLRSYLEALIKDLGLEDRVKLLGFRSDVAELYKTADLFIHPSFREGLPVAVMEAKASGLPIIASGVRGNRDLINSDSLFASGNETVVAQLIDKAINNEIVAGKLSEEYLTSSVIERMKEKYNAYV